MKTPWFARIYWFLAGFRWIEILLAILVIITFLLQAAGVQTAGALPVDGITRSMF